MGHQRERITKEFIHEDPYAVHFSPYFEYRELEHNIFGYDKYFKEFKSAVISKIYSYKVLCIDYKGHKLARFMDKNVSISCTEQLLICLRDLCREKLDDGSMTIQLDPSPLIFKLLII